MRFTVHRPASAEVSPRCHRSSGGDVAACGVRPSVAGSHIAGSALENRLALAALRGGVHEPGPATAPDQSCCLLTALKQPEPAHTGNITATTDNFPKGEKRRFLPLLKPRISTPQT